MKNKLYTLIIVLAVLLIPDFVSAQGRRVVTHSNTTGSTQAQKENPPVTTEQEENNIVSVPDEEATEEEENDEAPTRDIKVFYTLEKDSAFAHWSIAVGIGASIFDGDIRETAKRVVPTSRLDWGFTGVIERTFNPIWGLGLGYAAMPYSAKTETQQVRGFSNEWDVFLSVNMLNLFYRSRPQKWGIFVNLGMGMSYYNAKMTDRNTGEVVIGNGGNPMDLKGGVAIVWPFAALLEYNFSKDFAAGFKAEYRMHDKDNFEGHIVNVRQGNWNDAFEVFTLTLRYKPHFKKEYHVRNYHYGDPDMNDIEKRLADMEEMIRNMAKPTDTCCINNTARIAELEELLKKKPDTVVIVEKVPEPVKTITVEETKKIFNQALRGIQFETAKADIKPISFPILNNIVTIMRENPEYQLEIIGHTDNVAGVEYNQDLSERRANSVRMYLMDRGIDKNRLTAVGKGLTQPIATNSTAEGRQLNRRVEFVVTQNGKIILKSE